MLSIGVPVSNHTVSFPTSTVPSHPIRKGKNKRFTTSELVDCMLQICFWHPDVRTLESSSHTYRYIKHVLQRKGDSAELPVCFSEASCLWLHKGDMVSCWWPAGGARDRFRRCSCRSLMPRAKNSSSSFRLISKLFRSRRKSPCACRPCLRYQERLPRVQIDTSFSGQPTGPYHRICQRLNDFRICAPNVHLVDAVFGEAGRGA
jgi:hypothetical protein